MKRDPKIAGTRGECPIQLPCQYGYGKLAIIQLAEAGATDAQIQEVTGQSAEIVAYYRAKANRKALSKSAQKLRE